MATTPEGLAYARQQLAAGSPKPQVESALAAGGWLAEDIAELFAVIEAVTPPPPVPAQAAQTAVSQPQAIAAAAAVPEPDPEPIRVEVTPIAPEPVIVSERVIENPASPAITPASRPAPMPIPIPIQIPIPTPAPAPAPAYVPTPTQIPVPTPVPDEMNLDVGLRLDALAKQIAHPIMPFDVAMRQSSEAPPPRHIARKIAWSIALIILLSTAGAGAYAYFTGRLPLVEQYAIAYAGKYLSFLSHPAK